MNNIFTVFMVILYFSLQPLVGAENEPPKVEEVKLSGLYVGIGPHVNRDYGMVEADDDIYLYAPQNNPLLIYQKGDKIAKGVDLNVGAHVLLGYGRVFQNNFYLALEGQIGINYRPNREVIYRRNEEVDRTETKMLKGLEGFLLARIGYKLPAVPGIVYLSLGGQYFKIETTKKDKRIIKPTFGLGYQHGISEHWSIRGDVLYTHVNSIKLNSDAAFDTKIHFKYSGHQFSARLTLCYML
jgi:hypothetical protein